MSSLELCRMVSLRNHPPGPVSETLLRFCGRVTRRKSLSGVLLGLWFLLASCGGAVPVTGLRGEHPRVERSAVKVDSLQPEFRWESFPRPRDHEQDKEGILKRIDGVTYELRVWKLTSVRKVALHDIRVEPIYSRQGIKTPSHRIDKPLEPSTIYFWTVRARFEIDGHPRVTQWGARFKGPRSTLWRDHEISIYGYPFLTPAQ